MNDVKPVTAEATESSFDDITMQFKKRCAEIVLEKIWLTPIKVWVRDELGGKLLEGVAIPKSDQVRPTFIFLFSIEAEGNCLISNKTFCYYLCYHTLLK